MSRKITGLVSIVISGVVLPAWAVAGVLFCHDFTSSSYLTVNNSATLHIGPAPGGKLGPVLWIENPRYANSGGRITPNVSLPNDVSVVFRLYIDQHQAGRFQGVTLTQPGAGLVIRDDGTFGGSQDVSFGVSWAEDTWYTIALVLVAGGDMDVYVKEGMDAALASTDKIGSVAPATGRPMKYADFLTFGGDLFVADFTVNSGVDLQTFAGCSASNDACSSARVILSGVYAGTTSFATADGSSSCGNSNGSPDVWYRYTATCDGDLLVSTCSANFNTVVSVHSGCPGTAVNEIASGCSDDCGGEPCAGPGSCVTATATSGTTYWIRVAGANNETGTFELRVSCRGSGRYFEDFESGAGGWTGDGAYWSATGGIDDSGYSGGWRDGYAPYHTPLNPPASASLMGNLRARFGDYIHFSYWVKDILGTYTSHPQFYIWGPGNNIWGLDLRDPNLKDWVNVDFTVDTTWSDDEARAAGWYNSPWNGGSFAAVWTGVRYYNFLTGSGNGRVETGIDNVLVEAVAAVLPVNDHCEKAVVITDGATKGSTTNATKSGTASCGNSNDSPDVWYAYTATYTGTMAVDTCGSSFDTVLTLYSGACGNLTELACSDDCGGAPCAAPYSCLSQPVTLGDKIVIRVAGKNGAKGAFQLNVKTIPPVPPNNACGNAIALDEGVEVSGTTQGATNDGDAGCGNSGLAPDVWYTYTPACSDHLKLEITQALYFYPVISVHTACLGSVNNQIGCLSSRNGKVLYVPVQAGTPYLIRVGGEGISYGDFALKASCGVAPPPDCTFDFNSGAQGWGGDNALWVPTGGVEDSGYSQTTRDTFYPYHAAVGEPAASCFNGDLVAAYGPDIRISYWVKTISVGVNQGLGVGFFTTDGNYWFKDVIAPVDQPMDWTQVVIEVSNNWTTEQAMAQGWTDGWSTGASWTGQLQKVLSWNLWFSNSQRPGVGGTNATGIDNVKIEPASGLGCNKPFADMDGDSDVDQVDFAVFQLCYTGPAEPASDACRCLDHDLTGRANGAIDGFDFLAFEACVSGPAVPADPACGG